jgi:hypothetical protein
MLHMLICMVAAGAAACVMDKMREPGAVFSLPSDLNSDLSRGRKSVCMCISLMQFNYISLGASNFT